jgi:hypothetical protein
MRKLALILAVLFISSLTACNRTDNLGESVFGEDGVLISSEWTTEQMTYFVTTYNEVNDISPVIETIREDGTIWQESNPDFDENNALLLYATDHATANSFPLCDRPNCSHNSSSCNAYIPRDNIEEDWGSFAVSRSDSSAVVFIDGDFIYSSNRGNTFYRWRLNGTNRTQVARFPDKYRGRSNLGIDLNDNGWLMNGKLYLQVTEELPVPSSAGERVGVSTLLEVDYLGNNETRTLWQHNPFEHNEGGNSHVILFGAFGGKIFVEESHYPPWSEEMCDIERSVLTYTKLFAINPAANADDEIIEPIISGNGNEFISNIGHSSNTGEQSTDSYFYSRNDSAITHLDLLTGNTQVIAADLPEIGAYAVNLGRVFDGHLTIMAQEIADAEIGCRLYYVNIDTGEFMQSTIGTKVTFEDNVEYGYHRILREDDDYFYIVIERSLVESTTANGSVWHLIGRISKADYWANNENAVEEVDWIIGWVNLINFEQGADLEDLCDISGTNGLIISGGDW